MIRLCMWAKFSLGTEVGNNINTAFSLMNGLNSNVYTVVGITISALFIRVFL